MRVVLWKIKIHNENGVNVKGKEASKLKGYCEKSMKFVPEMVAKGLYICNSPVIFSLWNSADSKSSSQFETKLVFIMKFYLEFLNGILYYF